MNVKPPFTNFGYKQFVNKAVGRQLDEKVHNRETIMASRFP